MKKKIPRLYTGPDGKSRFEDIELQLECKLVIGGKSISVEPAGVTIIENDGHDLDWHSAKHRRFSIVVEGDCEIEAGDGTKRRFRPGDILLVDDTTGQGHYTRTVDGQRRKGIFVSID